MSDKLKNIYIKLPTSLWKKVKILSVHNDSTINNVINEIVEKYLNSKKIENIVNEDN